MKQQMIIIGDDYIVYAHKILSSNFIIKKFDWPFCIVILLMIFSINPAPQGCEENQFAPSPECFQAGFRVWGKQIDFLSIKKQVWHIPDIQIKKFGNSDSCLTFAVYYYTNTLKLKKCLKSMN